MKEYGLPFEGPILELDTKIGELEKAEEQNEETEKSIRELKEEKAKRQKEIFANLSPWDRVQVARHPLRPVISDYISFMFDDFIELHGDRRFGDDKAIVSGFGSLNGQKVMLVAHRKGKDTKQRLACNYGMPHPEGYRKALLKMKLAAKLKMPVVSLIDTAGAYPGIGAEERGIANSIAENLFEMSRLETPIVCVVIGEGGSGGALGIGVGDKFAILENAYYSVITPEGCASILWRNTDNAADAAAAMKLTAKDLYEFGIVDEIIPEPLGAAHRNPQEMAQTLKAAILRYVTELKDIPIPELLEERYYRFRRVGAFTEARVEAAVEEENTEDDG